MIFTQVVAITGFCFVLFFFFSILFSALRLAGYVDDSKVITVEEAEESC